MMPGSRSALPMRPHGAMLPRRGNREAGRRRCGRRAGNFEGLCLWSGTLQLNLVVEQRQEMRIRALPARGTDASLRVELKKDGPDEARPCPPRTGRGVPRRPTVAPPTVSIRPLHRRSLRMCVALELPRQFRASLGNARPKRFESSGVFRPRCRLRQRTPERRANTLRIRLMSAL